MSTELTIATDKGQSLAELMGVSQGTGNQTATPSIARMGMLHQPIMGEVDFNGKTIKTEVVPIGAFILTRGEEKVYSNGITVRVFAQRQQWQRWNSATEEMEKSVMSNSLNGDLKLREPTTNTSTRSTKVWLHGTRTLLMRLCASTR